jgi:transglutaminase superfamily protein
VTLAPSQVVRVRWRVSDLIKVTMCVACLATARLAIRVVPFVRLQSWLGRPGLGGEPAPDLDASAIAQARRISQILQRAAARTPWASNCYSQALAARFQLGVAGIPHTVSFGLRRNDLDALEAHAWVVAGDVVVTGGGVIGDYTEVSSFTWVPHGRRSTAGTPE